MVRSLIVIPARYQSSRFPGKPLAMLRDGTGAAQSLIERSWRAAMAVPGVARVVVATDDARIAAPAEAFGAEVVMTSEHCRNGTERTAEALDRLGGGYDAVVNFQGDAPLTPPWFVTALLKALDAGPEAGFDAGAAVATPIIRSDPETVARLREDRRAGRVGATTAVAAADGRALYFSKEVLPFQGPDPSAAAPVFHHVGLYAFTPAALTAYTTAPEGALERAEGLEQLRFLEAGVPITCVEVDPKGRAFWELNLPEDVARIEAILAADGA